MSTFFSCIETMIRPFLLLAPLAVVAGCGEPIEDVGVGEEALTTTYNSTTNLFHNSDPNRLLSAANTSHRSYVSRVTLGMPLSVVLTKTASSGGVQFTVSFGADEAGCILDAAGNSLANCRMEDL